MALSHQRVAYRRWDPVRARWSLWEPRVPPEDAEKEVTYIEDVPYTERATWIEDPRHVHVGDVPVAGTGGAGGPVGHAEGPHYPERTCRPVDLTGQPHYADRGIEPIDVIEDWGLGFNLGNVVKYVARAPHKGTEIDDLTKARNYLTREINRLNGKASWDT